MATLKHTVKKEKVDYDKAPSEYYEESTYIQVSKEMLQKLKVGDMVTFEVSGKVKSLRSDENMIGRNNNEVCIILKTVTFEVDENEFSELAED